MRKLIKRKYSPKTELYYDSGIKKYVIESDDFTFNNLIVKDKKSATRYFRHVGYKEEEEL